MKVLGVWEEYDKDKEYFDNELQRFTPLDMEAEYPASIVEKMAVRVVGNVVTEVNTIMYLRAEYGVNADMTDEQALEYINTECMAAVTESSPLERIAASLEYLTMILTKKE